jgi:gliding motility-associated protein GldE
LDPDSPDLALLSDAPSALAIAFSLEPTAVTLLLVTFVLLLLASAFFSGSEVALFSIDGVMREVLSEANDAASERVLRLLKHPRRLLVTILLLNTLTNVAAAILAALLTAHVALEMGLNHTLVVVIEVLALTFVLLVVSEITPKLVATQHALRFSRRISGPLWVLHRTLSPLSALLAGSMHSIQRWLKPSTLQRISSDDVKAMAEIGEEHGSLELQERELINSIVEFGETTVREIMISRLDVVALPVTATLPEALQIIRESGHSRLPLYVEHLDNILGIIYAKDLLPYLHDDPLEGEIITDHVDLTRMARPPMFVPQGRKLDDLLKDFQRKKTHMAIVVDEYGGTAGLVTLEDVLEEIVGDIRDEHDEPDELLYEQLDPDTYRFDARINLDEINDLLDLDLDTERFDFETLGGLIFHLAGDIPGEGDALDFEMLHLEVETVDNHRIGQVRVSLRPSLVDDDHAEASPPRDE